MSTTDQKHVTRRLAQFTTPLLILAGGGLGFVLLGSLKEEPPKKEDKVRAPLVETIGLEEFRGTVDLEVSGQVVPFRESTLAAEVGGRIVAKSADAQEGRFVRAGATLVEIDPSDYRIEVERLERQVTQAEVNLDELEVQIKNTARLVELAEEDVALQAREVKRIEDLAERKSVSESQVDKAKRAELTARNALVSQQNEKNLLETRRSRIAAALGLAEKQLEKARLDLKRCTIKAPYDGVVISDSVEEGDFVSPGTTVLAIEDVSRAEVSCNLQMDEIYWIWEQTNRAPNSDDEATAERYKLPNLPVTVAYSLAGREYTWRGVLDRYEGVGLDERTRTVPCRIVVNSPGEVRQDGRTALIGPPALVRGMYCDLRIHVEPREDLWKLPEAAVQPGNRVWFVRDGKLHDEPVRVARAYRDYVLIYADSNVLEAEDGIVVSPASNLTPGTAVRERSPR